MGNKLEGRIAIVTGAGRGIGASVARLFASEEAQEGIHAFLERRPPAWRGVS